ncbi:efflux RND transporter permease subunit, partial [candidate division KSB1 bacterium]|nr:efflux RND transporter permease subunit [candidate division KSB1 bacterium]
VGMPITAGTVTTIAVFLPVIYIYGAAGQLFREQALTVTFSLLASLVVAVTLLPALVAHFSGSAPKDPAAPASTSMSDKDPAWHEQGVWKYLTFPFKILIKLVKIIFIEPFIFLFHTIRQFYKFIQKWVVKWSEPLFQHFEKYYQYIFDHYERMLERSLQNRGRLLFIVGLAAGFCLLYSYFFLTRELMPRVDSGEFTITIQMPPGYSLDATSQTVSQIEQQLLKISDVEAVFATIGMTSEQFSTGSAEAAFNRGKMQVQLKNNRQLSTAEVIQRIRQQSGQLADASITFESSANVLQQILGTTSPPLALKIRGENLEVSLQLAQQVIQKIATIDGLKDLHLNLELGRPEISLQLDREAMGRLGLSAAQVSNFIQSYMKGNIATYFKDFDKKIEVWVRPTVENRDEIEDLLNTFILFDEKHIPLRALLQVNERLGPTEILREEQSRQVVVYGQVQGRGFNAVINEIQARLAEITLPETHRIEISGEQEELQQSFRSLLLALVLSVALIYMILAAQFESLMHPFVILLDIPISMALTFGLLTLLGLSLNVISFIGLIVLAGVAVNDSIVKVDFINQMRREGSPMMEAIMLAGQKRFRPIVMTSATTVLGLIPMALGFGEGAELQRPLAVTILGGITISTFVSLVLVPVLYSVMERGKGE